MTDGKKFKLLIAASVSLVLLILSYAIFAESLLPDLEGYIQRRVHYERGISQKGLNLHKGMYWKEKR